MTSTTQPFARAVASLVAEHDVADVLAHFLMEGLEALGGNAASCCCCPAAERWRS